VSARRYVLFTIAAVLTLAGDQLSKAVARANLVVGHPVPFIDGVWGWQLSYNTGVAFGLFRTTEGARILLTLVGLVAAIVIVVVLRKMEDRAWTATALGLVFGGAVGNALIDRLAFGQVTDFILWRVGSHRWPMFNVADAALLVGVLLLFLDIGKKPAKKK
jgi:signal peptidase II